MRVAEGGDLRSNAGADQRSGGGGRKLALAAADVGADDTANGGAEQKAQDVVLASRLGGLSAGNGGAEGENRGQRDANKSGGFGGLARGFHRLIPLEVSNFRESYGGARDFF